MNKFLEALRRFVSKNAMFVALIVICILLSILSPRFFDYRNFMNIIMQSATMGIVAVGMTFVIITGGIDLSVGSVLALAAAVGAGAMIKVQWPVPVAIVLMLGVGALFGLVHGILISRLALPAFIVTLAGMSIARGFTMVFLQGRTIRGLSEGYQFLANGQVFGFIPCAAIILAVIYAVAHYVLKFTTYGRSVYALGGNREATTLSGINSKRVETIAFVISGVTAGIGAVILNARLGSAIPTAGESLELDAIGAVVIGGASLSGGRGTIIGTLIGVFILGVINNGLNLLNVDPFYQGVVRGAVILIAVLIDTVKKQ